MTDWPEWRPIKTAPRDGTPFLAYWGGDVIETQIRIRRLSLRGEMWFESVAGERAYVDGDAGPTHWLPLPPPPKDKL